MEKSRPLDHLRTRKHTSERAMGGFVWTISPSEQVALSRAAFARHQSRSETAASYPEIKQPAIYNTDDAQLLIETFTALPDHDASYDWFNNTDPIVLSRLMNDIHAAKLARPDQTDGQIYRRLRRHYDDPTRTDADGKQALQLFDALMKGDVGGGTLPVFVKAAPKTSQTVYTPLDVML